MERLQTDPQMKHAIVGFSVVKSETGEKVFEVNAQTGLAPASCQKIITSAAAMEILGPSYRYQTVLGYNGTINEGTLKGNLYVIGSGDPSLGSWRYDSTKENLVLNNWLLALQQKGIRKIDGDLIGITDKLEPDILPGGWIWDDIGNYYGAGVAALNWRENQYDLVLQSGSVIGDKVSITAMKPQPFGIDLESRLLSAAKGTGDNAYIYLPPNATKGYVKGTIPVDEKAFTISGSFPDPPLQLLATLNDQLKKAKPKHFYYLTDPQAPIFTPFYTQYSPTLDSLNYWFMKKSINLYGEALIKTIAYEKTGRGSTEKGVEQVKKFWKEQGIEPSALHMIDGSGLSPQNRVTADALVKVLQYARSRPWFHYYEDALPIFNQMKLKSGTIGGAKSFAGYHTAKEGTTYTVAIIVNNFDGSAGEVVKKMYKVLDELK
jgi:D-alanyl-D-alanine carboxypeptidase/D-alanyl-D-alanine-endopeptidase (penicillin-binding protein 4)